MNISDYKSLYSQRLDYKSSRTAQIQPNVAGISFLSHHPDSGYQLFHLNSRVNVSFTVVAPSRFGRVTASCLNKKKVFLSLVWVIVFFLLPLHGI